MSKLFLKSPIFIFGLVFLCAFLIFYSGPKFFTASLTQAPEITPLPDLTKDLPTLELQVPVFEQKEARPQIALLSFQDQLDEIAEKLDIIQQQVDELVVSHSVVDAIASTTEDEVEEQEEQAVEMPSPEVLAKEEVLVAVTSPPAAAGGGSTPVVYPQILISEIQISPINQRFVELYNPNETDVDLTGWYLQRKTETGSDFTSFVTKNDFSGKTIIASGYFLISRGLENSDILIDDLTLTENNFLVLKNPNRDPAHQVAWQEVAENLSSCMEFDICFPTPKSQNIAYVAPPEEPKDTTPPAVLFSLAPAQNSLSFPINFEIADPIDTVSPSGLKSFIFHWKEEAGDWQEDAPVEIVGNPMSHNAVRDFTGQGGKTYYFQINALDVAQNYSGWLPEIPVFTTVSASDAKAILINEIQVAPIEQRFVELYNPNETDVDLTGWYLQRKTKNKTPEDPWDSFVSSTHFEGKIISAGGYFLISREVENSDILFDITLNDDDSLALKNSDREIIDKVGWGQSADPEGVPALNIPDSKSITRIGGADTDDNSIDFTISEPPTPKSE